MFIHVKVTAGVKEQMVKKVGENRYEIKVREKAERNMANRKVMEIVAGIYGVPIKAVRIVSGHHSPSKLLSIHE